MYITKTECLLEVLEGSKALALGFNMTVLRKLHIPTSPRIYMHLQIILLFCYLHGNSMACVCEVQVFHHGIPHITSVIGS